MHVQKWVVCLPFGLQTRFCWFLFPPLPPPGQPKVLPFEKLILCIFHNLHTPFPPFSLSLMNLMVSVDVNHHVYLLTNNGSSWTSWCLPLWVPKVYNSWEWDLKKRFPGSVDLFLQCCIALLVKLSIWVREREFLRRFQPPLHTKCEFFLWA